MTTTTVVNCRDLVACKGTCEIVDTVADTLNADRFHFTVRCSCGHERRINAWEGWSPSLGFHVRPDAPLHLLLRAAAQAGQHGHSRHPSGFYISSGGSDAGALYWARESLRAISDGLSDDKVQRLGRLSKRYQRFYRYMRNEAPGWVEWNRTHWADNSIDVNEVATDGSNRVRSRQVTAPHGDACF